jgi:hypothetical protein
MYRSITIFHCLGLSILAMLLPALMLGCAAANGQHSKSAACQPAIWYEGQQKKSAWLACDELAVFISKGPTQCATEAHLATLLGPSSTVCGRLAGGLIFKIPPSAASSDQAFDRRINSLKAQPCVTAVGLVYYTDPGREPTSRLIHTDELIVRWRPALEPAQIAALEADFGLTLKTKLRYAPNTMIYTVRTPLVILETADKLHNVDGVQYAYSNWLRSRVTK